MEQWPNLYHLYNATKCEFRTLQPNHSVTSRTKILISNLSGGGSKHVMWVYCLEADWWKMTIGVGGNGGGKS